jgi:hypothetical protein
LPGGLRHKSKQLRTGKSAILKTTKL